MDKNYWEEFYKKQNEELKPSLFARYIKDKFLKQEKSLIELGCGNGRDALFFANNNINVVAVDQCANEIKFLTHRYEQLNNINFQCDDFSNLSDNTSFDIVYSRFTLHSITKEQETRVLKWAFRNLNTAGLFCIEVRGTKNEIYKLGEPVSDEKNAYIYNEHYRRFIELDELVQSLKQIGFTIELALEDKGFAPYDGKDEIFIRIVAKK